MADGTQKKLSPIVRRARAGWGFSRIDELVTYSFYGYNIVIS